MCFDGTAVVVAVVAVGDSPPPRELELKQKFVTISTRKKRCQNLDDHEIHYAVAVPLLEIPILVLLQTHALLVC